MTLDLLGFTFAFTSGFLSIFSPCGYALLPSYISYYLGKGFSLFRAILGGFICTLGLMTVFAIIGLIASSIGELVSQLIPFLNVAAGVILVIMGVISLKQDLLLYVSIPIKISKREGLFGLYLFGLAYGMAGAGCSAPIFISIIFFALSKGLINGLFIFLIYAVGMGVPLILTSVLLAGTNDYIISRISSVTPRLQRISGFVLIIAGAYLFYLHYATYIA